MVAVSLKKIFFKQKTAYEMSLCDWSSDVCSSDLVLRLKDRTFAGKEETIKGKIPSGYDDVKDYVVLAATDDPAEAPYRLGNILIRYCLRR